MAVVATTMSTSAALEAFFAMLGKTDGRDKMLATLQYASMFVGGMDKNSQATVLFKALGGARKPFRFVKVSMCVCAREKEKTIKNTVRTLNWGGRRWWWRRTRARKCICIH